MINTLPGSRQCHFLSLGLNPVFKRSGYVADHKMEGCVTDVGMRHV